MPEPLPPSVWDFDPQAWPDDDFVALGADLDPSTLIAAYRAGAFPMPYDHDSIGWWSPMKRGVLMPGDVRVSSSLRKSMKKFDIRIDTAFDEVIAACGDPARPGGWIDDRIAHAYRRLHDLGWAHSVETWRCEELVGGLYGLSIGTLFAGESMFHHATDASKAALVGLVSHLESMFGDNWLIDTQWQTEHLASLGVSTLPRPDYLRRLQQLTAPKLPIWRKSGDDTRNRAARLG